ncbi:hypothetical protein JB92DRAFT_2830902 [Gautieria morchelliformis]|nr:hypothetical protein JB92DRAFT_2830902 [Gautieria morchelliformis]
MESQASKSKPVAQVGKRGLVKALGHEALPRVVPYGEDRVVFLGYAKSAPPPAFSGGHRNAGGGLIVKLSWQVDQTTQTSPMDQYTASPLFHACSTWASANAIGGRSPSGRVVLLGDPNTEEAVECIHSGGSLETWSHDGLSPFSPKENGVGECMGAAPRRSREGTPGEQGLWATFEEFTQEDIEKIDVWITPKKSTRRPSATGDPGSPGPNRGAMPATL